MWVKDDIYKLGTDAFYVTNTTLSVNSLSGKSYFFGGDVYVVHNTGFGRSIHISMLLTGFRVSEQQNRPNRKKLTLTRLAGAVPLSE